MARMVFSAFLIWLQDTDLVFLIRALVLYVIYLESDYISLAQVVLYCISEHLSFLPDSDFRVYILS